MSIDIAGNDVLVKSYYLALGLREKTSKIFTVDTFDTIIECA